MDLQLSIDSSSNVIEILADYLTNSDHNVLTILLAIVSEKKHLLYGDLGGNRD